VFRYRLGARTTFAAARSGAGDGVPAPEVDAALYPFPHDRKLEALPRLPGRLIAWAAEQSATAKLPDGAYAKVQRGDGERRGLRALAGQDAVRVPRVLDDRDGVLTLEPLRGDRLDALGGVALEAALRGLGETLAALHNLKVPGTFRFERLAPERLATAAEVIARARPDAGDAARRLVERLGEPPAQPDVPIHGDVNLGNAVWLELGRVGLLDLEHLALGPAAADVGQVVANLLVTGRPARPFLEGYGRPLDRPALAWYTAASLLARVALPAVSRYRPELIARLPRLLP
jgi:Ser/Thr protein kinase RdoA (MazF antagonist)